MRQGPSRMFVYHAHFYRGGKNLIAHFIFKIEEIRADRLFQCFPFSWIFLGRACYTSIKRFAHFPLLFLPLPLFSTLSSPSVSSPLIFFLCLFCMHFALCFFCCIIFLSFFTCSSHPFRLPWHSRSLLPVALLFSFTRPSLHSPTRFSALQSSLVLRRHLIIIFRTVCHACRRVARPADKISRDIVFGIIAIINAPPSRNPSALPFCASGVVRIRAIPNLYRAFNSQRLRYNFVLARKADRSTKMPQQNDAYRSRHMYVMLNFAQNVWEECIVMRR